jgi:hypothetical protein
MNFWGKEVQLSTHKSVNLLPYLVRGRGVPEGLSKKFDPVYGT